MASNKITVNIEGLDPFEITHHEEENEWDELSIKLIVKNIEHLAEVAPVLKENELTINDFLASLIEYCFNNKEKVKAFCSAAEGDNNG